MSSKQVKAKFIPNNNQLVCLYVKKESHPFKRALNRALKHSYESQQ